MKNVKNSNVIKIVKLREYVALFILCANLCKVFTKTTEELKLRIT